MEQMVTHQQGFTGYNDESLDLLYSYQIDQITVDQKFAAA
jgi:hypothetical protein